MRDREKMKQYGRTINLKNDPKTIERYLEHHRAIWPEVGHGLKAIGIQRMLIWMLGRQLFMFMETTDEFEPERMARADGLDAGGRPRRPARRMVGRDETGFRALKEPPYFFHSAPVGNSNASIEAGSISILNPGAVGTMYRAPRTITGSLKCSCR